VAGVSDLFGTLDGGRVLDVATGKGPFVESLIEELHSYTEIIGLDRSEDAAAAFEDAHRANRRVRFVQADAHAMPFESDSFGTVAIVGSLHHMAAPAEVLTEMLRVLEPGGTFIVGEQIRDRLTKAEQTHRLFHEWSEEIMGVAFRATYRRAKIIEMVDGLGLDGVQAFIERDDSDPMEAENVSRWDQLIAEFVERGNRSAGLRARGRAIGARLHVAGIVISPALYVVGWKHPRAGS
jgi:SAM-dependent methyltransferase